MAKKRSLLPLVALGVGLAVGYRYGRRGAFGQVKQNLRTFSMPSTAAYDAIAGLLFGGFYDRVAREIAAACPTGSALEVGSGPGQLAVRIAEIVPRLAITAVDITPDMVRRARRRAAQAGLADRLSFESGDVAALPFADEQFDIVFSVFSLHHWDNPAQGVSEIYRVLKPGGKALIYDLSPWIADFTHHGQVDYETLIRASRFGSGSIRPFRGPWPITAIARIILVRPPVNRS